MSLAIVYRAKAPVEVLPNADEETAAIDRLRESGLLLEAFGVGCLSAALVCQGERSDVEEAMGSLPFVRDGIVDAEIVELRWPH